MLHLIYNSRMILTRYILLFFLSVISPGNISSAFQFTMPHMNTPHAHILNTCNKPAAVTTNSLLIVLLDTSYPQTSSINPQQNSSIVTKLLADLWPGQMAIIPLQGSIPNSIVPLQLSTENQRQALKAEIEKLPPTNTSFLAPALQKALTLSQHAKNTYMLILTGAIHDNQQQEPSIRALLQKFCQSGVAIDAFSIGMDPSSYDGQEPIEVHDTYTLLNEVSERTGTIYMRIDQSQNLTQEVLKRYAHWRGLTYSTSLPDIHGNYPITIDDAVTEASIISLRSSSIFPIAVLGPDAQPTTDVDLESSDSYYIVNKTSPARKHQTTNYTITTSADPHAQVFILIDSSLKITLDNPTDGSKAYIDQPIPVNAHYMNATQKLIPPPNTAIIKGISTLFINGTPAPNSTNTFILSQEKTTQGNLSDSFAQNTQIYRQPGILQIEVSGKYNQASRQTILFLELLPFPNIPPIPPPPWPQTVAFGLLTACLLGILAFIFFQSRKPKGT